MPALHQKNSADRSTQKIVDEIDVNIGSSVVLENDIEEELGLPNGGSSKPYVALSHITAEGFTVTPQMEQKIRKIYGAEA